MREGLAKRETFYSPATIITPSGQLILSPLLLLFFARPFSLSLSLIIGPTLSESSFGISALADLLFLPSSFLLFLPRASRFFSFPLLLVLGSFLHSFLIVLFSFSIPGRVREGFCCFRRVSLLQVVAQYSLLYVFGTRKGKSTGDVTMRKVVLFQTFFFSSLSGIIRLKQSSNFLASYLH
jgi:hypothetical protein